MLFKMKSLGLSQSPMKVELRLDKIEPAYTHQETLSGEVVLHTESPADLSTIVLDLSGTATSRLTQSRHTETHNLFKRSHRIFPSDHLVHYPNSSSVTIGSGNHILRFSIKIPQVIECYKTGHWSNKPQISCANIGSWPKTKLYLLRKTPPSTGNSDSLAEIKYSLSAVVVGKSTVKKTQNIIFHAFSDPIPHQKPFKQQCSIGINPNILDSDSPLSFRIDTELQNGACLLLGNSIPLSMKITKLGDSRCKVLLSAFQTMLVETTQVKAQGTSESSTSTWIVQSTANMNYPVGFADAPRDSTVSLRDTIWANHHLPPEITSSFEVCNIKRMYRLNLRLAFLVGDSKLQTVIRELEFPVYVMGPIVSLEALSAILALLNSLSPSSAVEKLYTLHDHAQSQTSE